jgi:acyl-CoA thioesterase
MLDIIKYENLEDFIGLLKAAVDKKTPVYVDVVRLKHDDDVMTMKISFMVIHNGFLHQCFFSEGMPELRLVPESVFDVLSTEKLRMDALADYQKSVETYDENVKKEYGAAEDLIKEQGFPVVMGVVQ